MRPLWKFLAVISALAASPAWAQSGYAEQAREADASFTDFRFRSGETIPTLRIHYRTLGTPKRDAKGIVVNAVLVLHGTGGSGASLLTPSFAGELFGPGQALDISRYYIILPDNIGHGKSSKPSDGLRMRFPKYDYADMVDAQRRLLDTLKVDRLRLLFGTSMGCMHGFVWGTTHPQRVRAMMPMACYPMQIAGHNRMWRKAIVDGIQKDPAWRGGDYTAQPEQGLRLAATVMQIVGSAPLYLQKTYPAREAAEAFVTERIEKDIASRDANDLIYQLESSRTYDPSADLEKITTPTVWINSSDDFINPWDYGIAEKMASRMPDARYVLTRATDETRGHGNHSWARFWKQEMIDLLARTEK